MHYWSPEDLEVLKGPVIVFTQAGRLDKLADAGYEVQALRHFPHFHISQLTGPFINYRTRDSVTEDWVVARVGPNH